MTISHLFKQLSSIVFIINPIGRLRVFCSKVYNLQLEHKLYFKTWHVVLFVFCKYKQLNHSVCALNFATVTCCVHRVDD
jgi:small neutral amino acid transporter SnatA (MarC family)